MVANANDWKCSGLREVLRFYDMKMKALKMYKAKACHVKTQNYNFELRQT
jgi:hypothetical protein